MNEYETKANEIYNEICVAATCRVTREDVKAFTVVAVEQIIKAVNISTRHITISELDRDRINYDLMFWCKVKEAIKKM